MSYPVLHSVPGSGSTCYKYVSSLEAGDAPLGANPNEFAQRLTGMATYLINPEDVQSLSGPFRTTKVVVSTAATPLPSGTNLERRRTIAIANEGSAKLYIAHGSGVAATEAFPIANGGSLSFDLLAHQKIWARTLAGTADVRIIEIM